MSKFRSSKKQREIMRHICDAIAGGKELTLVELQAKLSYGPVSRQAVMCSIRFLEKHELVVKKIRGNKSMYLTPTARGLALFPITPPDFPALS